MLHSSPADYAPQPGDIGLTVINGDVGRLIRVGQWLYGDGWADWQHAFVVTDGIGPTGKPVIVEAEPGGARYVELYHDDVYWCTSLTHGFTDADREAVSQAACQYVGVPYSFLDYFQLAVHHLGIPAPGLQREIQTSKHMICSQLCDRVYSDCGKKIFSDGRWDGDVIPLDLYRRDVLLRAKYATEN